MCVAIVSGLTSIWSVILAWLRGHCGSSIVKVGNDLRACDYYYYWARGAGIIVLLSRWCIVRAPAQWLGCVCKMRDTSQGKKDLDTGQDCKMTMTRTSKMNQNSRWSSKMQLNFLFQFSYQRPFLILKANGLQQRKACALFCGSQTEPNVKMTCWRWQFLGSGSGPCALIMAIMDVWKARAARTPLGDSLAIFPGCTGARRHYTRENRSHH